MQRDAGPPDEPRDPQGNDAAPSEKQFAIAALAASELQGICDAVAQQATRAFTDGALITAQGKRRTADAVCRCIDKVGKVRSRMLTNAIIVKAFSSATLEAYRQAGVTHVGTVPEHKKILVARGPHGKHIVRDQDEEDDDVDVLTAGDDSVCLTCEDISDDGPYSLDDAEGLIPAHANCRCAFVPTSDRRFASVHEEEDQ
jgi:hypothetical protein